jgi:regulator of cell morphogenesis and NO signaling
MKQAGTTPINGSTTITEIVKADYRTADVFRKHGIEFCCGGRRPLEQVCEEQGVDTEKLQQELEQATKKVYLPNNLNFNDWSIEFLVDYIINIHHEYLKKSVHPAQEYLARFSDGHSKKFPYVIELAATFDNLVKEILPEIAEEEDIIFPYIRQVSHAYNSKAPYAGLLVRTLRKPVKNITQSKHQSVYMSLLRMRELSDHYTPPENACPNHKVTFQKLKEIDDDLIQHLYLENSVLFPKAVSLEKELLEMS